MRNASGQVKMSGSEKIKVNRKKTKSLVSTGKFDVLVVQNGIAARAILFFC